jgi:hypothetical protein
MYDDDDDDDDEDDHDDVLVNTARRWNDHQYHR